MAKADFIDISYLGDKKLQRKLNRMVIQAQRKIVRKAMREAMKPVVTVAKGYAPIDTGRLKRSLKLRSKTRRGNTSIRIVTGTREQLGIDPNAKGFYPAAIEYGSKNQAPRSYLRRAITERRNLVLDDMGQAINLGLIREGRK